MDTERVKFVDALKHEWPADLVAKIDLSSEQLAAVEKAFEAYQNSGPSANSRLTATAENPNVTNYLPVHVLKELANREFTRTQLVGDFLCGKVDFDSVFCSKKVWGIDLSDYECALREGAGFLKPKDIAFLLEQGVSPDTADRFGMTPIMAAASAGNFETLKTLLACSQANINAVDNFGRTALHHASDINAGEFIRLLRNGRERGGSNFEDYVAFFRESHPGKAAVVELLLEKGIDINAVDNLGKTALHYAAKRGLIEVAERLIDGGAKVDAVSHYGRTVLHEAASYGLTKMAKLLVEKGIDVRATTPCGDTALHFAAKTTFRFSWQSRSRETVKFLIEKGADPSARNNGWMTPRNLMCGLKSNELDVLFPGTSWSWHVARFLRDAIILFGGYQLWKHRATVLRAFTTS